MAWRAVLMGIMTVSRTTLSQPQRYTRAQHQSSFDGFQDSLLQCQHCHSISGSTRHCSCPLNFNLTTDHHGSPDSQLLHAIPPAIALFQGKPLLQPDQAVELVKAGQQLELVFIKLTLVQELPVHSQQGTRCSVNACTGGLVQVR